MSSAQTKNVPILNKLTRGGAAKALNDLNWQQTLRTVKEQAAQEVLQLRYRLGELEKKPFYFASTFKL